MIYALERLLNLSLRKQKCGLTIKRGRNFESLKQCRTKKHGKPNYISIAEPDLLDSY